MKLDLDQIKRDPLVLRLYGQRVNLKRDGKDYLGLCPFHSEKTPSFRIHQHEGVYLFKCFGCNRAGNIFQFVSELDHLTEKAAINKVGEFFGAQDLNQKVDEVFKPIGEPESQAKTSFPLEKHKVYEDALANNKEARSWLASRGIDYDTAKRLHIGFRQDIGKLAYGKNDDISNKGWMTFPCIENGQIVSLKYRSIVRKAFSRQPNMKTALFNSEAIDPLATVYIVEGEPDTLIMEQAGFNTVGFPNSTTQLTPEMRDQLHSADKIILAGDADTVGNDAMDRLWRELKDRTFYLKWPDGLKDANAVFLKKCKSDKKKFIELVDDLTTSAESIPMPGVYSLPEAMLSSKSNSSLADNPLRLRFPWPSVDRMVILLPGSVMNIFATNTKMGKTALVMNFSIFGAQKYNEVVLNYQVELSPEEFSTITAAHILRKDRNHLTKDDYQKAGKILLNSGVKYYVGSDPTLTTVTPVLDLIEAAIVRLGATVVILDHIHFIVRNEADENKAMANANQRIKLMARKYGVKFVVVGQPRKAMAQNRGKAVHLSDWKGSETGTSDADAVFAIHRDVISNRDPNNPPKDDYSPKTEIHLLGARSKGDGNTFATLMFHGNLATFWEETKIEPPPEARNNTQVVI